jgi:hypothetical protein
MQWLASIVGGSARNGERRGENRIRAQSLQILRAIKPAKQIVRAALIARVEPGQAGGDFAGDAGDSAGNASPAEIRRNAIAKLVRFMPACRRARRCTGAAERSLLQMHVGLNRRPAPRVENLPRHDAGNAR